MSLPFKPFAVEFEAQIEKWLVSQKVGQLFGTDFFVVCNDQNEAEDLAEQLNCGNLSKPTIDPSKYEIISDYTPMHHKMGRLIFNFGA